MSLDLPLPTQLYTASEVRELDRLAIHEYGIDGFDLMQRAARFSFHILKKRWPTAKQIIVFCGAGNNGGDGYIVAGLAKKHGLTAQVYYLSDPTKLSGDAQKAYQYAVDQGVDCFEFDPDISLVESDTILVDALLGTGINKEVTGKYAQAITLCNESKHPSFAIDIPSGLSADTGESLGNAIVADATATFIGLKIGQFTGKGQHYCGELFFDHLNVPESVIASITPSGRRLDLEELLNRLPKRARDAHKGQFGHVLLIGGDHGYGGAITLAAEACARMGSGLTSVATHQEHISSIICRTPEVMAKSVASSAELKPLLENTSVIVIGPGLGQSAWSQHMLFTALHANKPTVLDADALNLLCMHPDWLLEKHDQLVFTPHPGEAARLLKTNTGQVQSNRVAAITELATNWGGTFLLKGSGSLVKSKNETLALCPYGNPGMASGGMGDVLSGLLGGLIAQEMEFSFAVELAICLHAKAADNLAKKEGERGLLASDLIDEARTLLNRV